jgi:ferritin-like protein
VLVDDLTDELILYYYSIFLEAALLHYGLSGKPIAEVNPEERG